MLPSRVGSIVGVSVEEEPLVDEVLAAIEAGRPQDAKLLLHPYIHWTTASGETIRGRTKVLALLAGEQSAALDQAALIDVEVRDGQIYRWMPREAR